MNNSRDKIYVPREVERDILRYLDSPEIIAVVGPRQCGKTTLLQHIYSKLKKAIGSKFDVQVIDTETYWIGREAVRNKLPFCCIRSVSDDVDENVPDFLVNSFRRSILVNISNLLFLLVKSPKKVFQIAKVIRDKIMLKLSRYYPEYGFELNKGYGTPQHLKSLQKYGPSAVHRLTFRKVLD